MNVNNVTFNEIHLFLSKNQELPHVCTDGCWNGCKIVNKSKEPQKEVEGVAKIKTELQTLQAKFENIFECIEKTGFPNVENHFCDIACLITNQLQGLHAFIDQTPKPNLTICSEKSKELHLIINYIMELINSEAKQAKAAKKQLPANAHFVDISESKTHGTIDPIVQKKAKELFLEADRRYKERLLKKYAQKEVFFQNSGCTKISQGIKNYIQKLKEAYSIYDNNKTSESFKNYLIEWNKIIELMPEKLTEALDSLRDRFDNLNEKIDEIKKLEDHKILSKTNLLLAQDLAKRGEVNLTLESIETYKRFNQENFQQLGI